MYLITRRTTSTRELLDCYDLDHAGDSIPVNPSTLARNNDY